MHLFLIAIYVWNSSALAYAGSHSSGPSCEQICESLPPSVSGTLTVTPRTVKEYCLAMAAEKQADILNISILALDSAAIASCIFAIGVTVNAGKKWKRVLALDAEFQSLLGEYGIFLTTGLYAQDPSLTSYIKLATVANATAEKDAVKIAGAAKNEIETYSSIQQMSMAALAASQIISVIRGQQGALTKLVAANAVLMGMSGIAAVTSMLRQRFTQTAHAWLQKLLTTASLMEQAVVESTIANKYAKIANYACAGMDVASATAELSGIILMTTGTVGDQIVDEATLGAGAALGVGALALVGAKAHYGHQITAQERALEKSRTEIMDLMNNRNKPGNVTLARRLSQEKWNEGKKLAERGLNIAYFFNSMDVVVLSAVAAVRAVDLVENQHRMHENCEEIVKLSTPEPSPSPSPSPTPTPSPSPSPSTSPTLDRDGGLQGTSETENRRASIPNENRLKPTDAALRISGIFDSDYTHYAAAIGSTELTKVLKPSKNNSPLPSPTSEMKADHVIESYSAVSAIGPDYDSYWSSEALRDRLKSSNEEQNLNLSQRIDLIGAYIPSKIELSNMISQPSGFSSFLRDAFVKYAPDFNGAFKDQVFAVADRVTENSEFWKAKFGISSGPLSRPSHIGIFSSPQTHGSNLSQQFGVDHFFQENVLSNQNASSRVIMGPDIWHTRTDLNIFQIVSTTIEKNIEKRNVTLSEELREPDFIPADDKETRADQ